MLPFHVDSLFGISVKAAGVAIPKEDGIQIAFHAGEVPNNILDAKTQMIFIAWADLKTIKAKKGVFEDSLVIEVNSPDVIRDLPRAKDQRLTLEVQKSDRDQLDLFVKEVEGFRSGKNKDNTEEMIDDIRDFLSGL